MRVDQTGADGHEFRKIALGLFGRRRFLEGRGGRPRGAAIWAKSRRHAALPVERSIELVKFDAIQFRSILQQIDAGVLNVATSKQAPQMDRPAILLHGWPYDVHSFNEVGPRLASAGFRVIVPYARGFGTTRFRSKRNPKDRPPVRISGGHDRPDGRTEHPAGDDRRLRLGRAALPISSPRYGPIAQKASSR